MKRGTSRGHLAAGVALVAVLLAVGVSGAAAARMRAGTARHEVVAEELRFAGGVSTEQLPARYEFVGSLPGEPAGRLTVRIVSLGGPSTHYRATFDWLISSAAGSFLARTVGMWDARTGQVVTNGRVISGALRGARVQERGRILYPGSPTFEGSIDVVSAAASR